VTDNQNKQGAQKIKVPKNQLHNKKWLTEPNRTFFKGKISNGQKNTRKNAHHPWS
jgi:hypothetical protein